MRDDDLTGRLASLADDLEDGTFSAPASAVRSRGDRRRVATTTTTLAGLATLAVTTSVVLPTIAGSGGPLVDVGAFGTPTPSASTVPSGSPAASPSRTVPPSVTPTGSPRPTGSSGRTTFPPGLRMLHEGEAGWQRNEDRSIASTVNPCGGTVDATRPGRTAARTLTGRGHPMEEEHSPSLVTHQLFLYADSGAAARAFAKLATDAAACGWSNATPAMNPTEADTFLRLRSTTPGSSEEIKDRYWLHDAIVVLDGNALFLASAETKGAGMTSNLDDQEVGRMLAPTCLADLVCRER